MASICATTSGSPTIDSAETAGGWVWTMHCTLGRCR
ncbi:Uncharacterised protein [Bordetella pertussis]|nr:Uncharacterised protein [Bordetella pertussis]